MEKPAIEKIETLVKKTCEVTKVGDREFSRTELHVIKKDAPSRLKVASLTSMVDFLTNQYDDEQQNLLFCHVENPSKVVLYDRALDLHNDRQSLVCADVSNYIPEFHSGRGYDQEGMTVLLQTCFHQCEGRDKLIDSISKFRIENESDLEDDGFTQTVSAKAGVAMARRISLENPINLKPILTFSEIEPVARSYILRVKKCDRKGIEIVLHESESRAWSVEVMEKIKTYLTSKITNLMVI